MSLIPPNLDDRTFEQLLAECKRRIPLVCPTWTDFGESDPGMVLLELFAYLTEGLIYRQNRLPEKAYVEFLRLLGVKLTPPQAAIVELRFSVEKPAERDIEIPRGTRAAVGRSGDTADGLLFVTDSATRIPAGETFIDTTAHHCVEEVGELIGVGTGAPGLTLRVARPPIIAPLRQQLDLIVGVQSSEEEFDERQPSVLHEGKRFRIWIEQPSFANLQGDKWVYVADRMQGTIQFAPAVRVTETGGGLTGDPKVAGAFPAAGREIRVWYRRGGGLIGNAAANMIDTLKTQIPGVKVTNPREGSGGRDGETIENALVRGPQEMRTRERAVTADDFETLARQKLGAGSRAKALARAQNWRYAKPGTVDVLLVPMVPGQDQPGFRVSLDRLRDVQSEPLRDDIDKLLAERRPLAIQSAVKWTRYKVVVATGRVVVYRQENPQAVKERIIARLNQAISPLPNRIRKQGWNFGETLRAFHVHDCALNEPGVKFIDQVRFRVEEVPNRDVTAILPDPFQPETWYAASGPILYRTLNNGEGWEPAGRFPAQVVTTMASHPSRPGLLAAAAGKGADFQVSISRDCGETWEELARLNSTVYSMAWMDRNGEPILLLACEAGLFQRSLEHGKGPLLIPLTDQDHMPPPLAVSGTVNDEGQTCVAVALKRGGVWLSRDAAKDSSFRLIGARDADIRGLTVQTEGSRTFLWAAPYTTGDDEGSGCRRWELTRGQDPPEGWVSFPAGWKGGSCVAMAFAQSKGYAATHHAGILRLDTRAKDSAWESARIDAGLPQQGDSARLAPLSAVAADPRTGRVLAGSAQGVFRSDDQAATFRSISIRESDQVTLPDTWLFCPGEHELEVITEDEVN